VDNYITINTSVNFNSGNRVVDLSFSHQIAIGKITGVYGPSGVGKSSFFKLISGIVKPDKGEIGVGNEVWYSSAKKINVLPRDRSVAFVFQDYNLFPNMTVYQNLLYASSNNEIPPFIMQLANQIGVEEYMYSYPSELSGGQQQRAAILRAFAQESKLILMDEPFSSLDDEIAMSLIEIIKKMVQERQLTVIVASHRKEVLINLADDVLLFKMDGKHHLQKVTEAFC
jgi:molybdate transport system ATP-binding protein